MSNQLYGGLYVQVFNDGKEARLLTGAGDIKHHVFDSKYCMQKCRMNNNARFQNSFCDKFKCHQPGNDQYADLHGHIQGNFPDCVTRCHKALDGELYPIYHPKNLNIQLN